MNGVEIYKFIKPHLGSIGFSGCHSTDTERLDNFKIYETLINCLLEDLDQSLYSTKGRKEISAMKISNKAKNILIGNYQWLDEYMLELK